MAIIKAEKLTHIFQPGMPFEKKALDNVDLEIEQGDFVALIGHTGSGKSTLIQHFNALEKPTSGKIYIDGIDTSSPKADLKKVRRTVGLVFQYPEHQLFEETVFKDIAFGPKNMGCSDIEIRERVAEAMRLVGIPDSFYDRSPFELSGGQKRRVAIAGVLAMRPKVLVLDEPTAGLDPAGRDEILGAVVDLHAKANDMTVIFVSHSMEDVAKLAKHVIVMNRGRVAFTGTVREIFARSEELEKMGLDVPEITRVFRKLRLMGIPVPSDIFTVEQACEYIVKRVKGEGACV